ncbi:ShlB/FhaC/HecB family hemolysin secretion/activation protein [Bosea sp. CS1GBMeth4]|uniref:ShlB/FhaC/HecB family hemolysin secretion/activation protein n=1 Tax=Bosea sp. CS1GBMeth4 TaxID=1892849 RepID=UPI001645D9DE|nr:ShlB/FhaC/HecB family hemolysin secretion/activation protein [Bosea sp. CS1GBMeth4]
MIRCRPGRSRIDAVKAAAVLIALSPAALGPALAQSGRRGLPPIQPAEQSFAQRRAERLQDELQGAPVPSGPAASSQAADDKALFTLSAVRLEGETPLDPGAIASAYRDRLGQPVTQAGLVAIAGEISNLHRAAGFHLTRAVVPPQDVKGGVVRIRIIPGRIAELVVKGDENGRFGVRRLLAPVAEEAPARFPTLERRLMLVNDLPGVRVKDTTLEEIGTGSGRFRLTVILESWSLFVSAGFDNGGSVAAGPWQAYFGTALNSLLVPGDTLALNLSSVPGSTRELRYGRISYEAPVGFDWLRLGVAASRSIVWPGDPRRFERVRSDAENLEARATVVPLHTQRQSLWLTAAFGISDIVEDSAFGVNYRDRLRIASLTADYRLRDDWQGTTYATLGLRKGLGIDGASRRYDPLLSRFDGSGDFYVVHGAFTRHQGLGGDWSMKLAAAGQVSSEALLISQQFYLGGAAFGRAFQSGWLAGDNGVAGSAELRYDHKLDFPALKNIQIFGFVEGGAVRSYGQPKDIVQSLSAAGGGVRVQLGESVEAGITVAAPLSYNTPSKGGRGATVLFSLSTALRACPEQGAWRCG